MFSNEKYVAASEALCMIMLQDTEDCEELSLSKGCSSSVVMPPGICTTIYLLIIP